MYTVAGNRNISCARRSRARCDSHGRSRGRFSSADGAPGPAAGCTVPVPRGAGPEDAVSDRLWYSAILRLLQCLGRWGLAGQRCLERRVDLRGSLRPVGSELAGAGPRRGNLLGEALHVRVRRGERGQQRGLGGDGLVLLGETELILVRV